MKIAIVAPASVPYIRGGAENLYQSLSEHINECTSSSCEIVTLPSPENSFDEIIDSYKRFSELNLDRFDLVISTKYPSWMVSHNNHVCYMLHTLRGLYDTYSLMNLPDKVDWENEGLDELKTWMDNALQSPSSDNSELSYFFQLIEQLVSDKKDSALLSFPGPFVRELVHFLDTYALSSNRVKGHFAISSTVAKRDKYFPKGVNAIPLYPAPLINRFECKEFNYLFTTSRLDSPKRIDLIIESFKHVHHDDAQLIIAGEGPQRRDLERLAGKDGRIKFVGRVTDTELTEYYSNALAVIFTPYDEDYGYVTIEAMKSSKPVITTTDSGGPNEFIKHGKNGFSVRPDPKKIAQKIDFLCQNINTAQQMGALAAKTVEEITWQNVTGRLLSKRIDKNNLENKPKIMPKKKIVVVNTFQIYPPRGGGQARVFNLYRYLAKYFDIEIVCLCNPEFSYQSRTISPGLTETRVPVTSKFQTYEASLSESVDRLPVTDIAAIEGHKLLEKFKSTLEVAVKSADIVVASHPYLINAVQETQTKARVWYEAHNVELDLKKQLLPEGEASTKLLEKLCKVEEKCWLASEVVYACTDEDLVRLEELYGPTKASKITVPNGVDYDSSIHLDCERKSLLKKKLGIDDRKTALFMGSWHGPNLEAANYLMQLAPSFPDILFFFVGSAGLAFNDCKIPSNILMLGEVNDEEKQVVMCASDVAINPMSSGSGSNLKILDFLAHGLPVISTKFGARGFNLQPDLHYICSEIEAFPLELCKFFSLQDRYKIMGLSGRAFVKESYAWENIAGEFKNKILSSCAQPLDK